MSRTPTAVKCTDLRKRFLGGGSSVDAVDGLDLEIHAGECFGLLGPNGAGKTTTIEILEGIQEPTSGEVEILGLGWARHASRLRQRIGISLQETRFTDKLTVLETIRLFRSFYDAGLEPEKVLEKVSLGSKTKSWVEKLSGGQRQRLAVACALVGDPELLFLDEPTTGLDPQSRRQMWDIVREARQKGRTILLTTHYMDEAERLCDRVAVVDHGRVIALGPPPELIARLGGEHVIEFALDGGGAEAVQAPGERGLLEIPAVRSLRLEGEGIALTVNEPHIAIPGLLRWLEARDMHLSRLTTRHASLEDVFVTLTGRHLRDDARAAT